MAVQLFLLILFAVHFQEYLFLLICFVFVSFSYFFLIKSYNSSCHTVRKRGYLSSGSSRNVHGLSKYSVANLHKCLEILLFQIYPQFFFLLQVLCFLRPDTQNGRNSHHDCEIIKHIISQFLTFYIF